MKHPFTWPSSTRRAILRGVAPAVAAAILLGAGVVAPFPESSAGASTSSASSVICNAKEPRAIGHFLVSCNGSASALVTMSASLTPCTSASACATSSQLQFVVSVKGSASTNGYGFVGGSVSQLAPLSTTSSSGTTTTTGSSGATGSAGATSTTTTHPSTSSGNPLGKVLFGKLSFRYSVHVRGKVTKVLNVVVASAAKFGLSNPILGIQDSRNIADGAAKSQEVE